MLLRPTPQTIPFTILEGQRFTANLYFTFGFINAIVDAAGFPVLSSQGVTDFNVPPDGGLCLGGLNTNNDWGATDLTVNVALGTTFGGPGAEFPFYFGGLRTYSAQATGVIVVP